MGDKQRRAALASLVQDAQRYLSTYLIFYYYMYIYIYMCIEASCAALAAAVGDKQRRAALASLVQDAQRYLSA